MRNQLSPQDGIRKADMYKKIITGYDGSERALRAVEQAADLATATGAALHLVSACSKKDTIYSVGESTDKRYHSDSEIAQDLSLIHISEPTRPL